MGMSFREKSLWGSAGAILFVTGLYMAAFNGLMGKPRPTDMGDFATLAISGTISLIIVLVAYHISISVFGRRIESRYQDPDERDKLIEARAAGKSQFVLSLGIFATIGYLVYSETIGSPTGSGSMTTVHILLGSVVLAELTNRALQIIDHRRGV